jgi:tetratricopeptide (TPR) repeat protein
MKSRRARETWFDPRGVGQRIQEARGDRSQRELGEALGYLQPHISRYERGSIPGSFKFLAGLSALLGVDLNWLLTGRVASEPADRSPGHVPAGLTEALTRAVTEALHGVEWPADLEGSPREMSGASTSEATATTKHRPEVLPVLAPNLTPWDRLALELPILLMALAEAPFQKAEPRRPDPPATISPAVGIAGTTTAEGSRLSGQDRAESLLESLRRAREEGDAEESLRILMQAAEQLEGQEASVVTHERVRFLLLWAWLVAEGRSGDGVDSVSARLLFQLARATRKTGRLDEADRFYRLAAARAETAGLDALMARCRAGLGHLCFERGDFDAARSEYVAVLEAALRLGSPELLFFAYLDLSMYYHEHERAFGKAAEYAASGLEIARREGDREHVGLFLNELGLNAMELGDVPQAEARFDESLRVAEELRNPRLLAIARINLGELRLRLGEVDAAVALLRDGRAAAADVGLTWAECQAEILLARCDHVRARTASALERLEAVEDRCAANALDHERELARGLEREIRQSLLGRLNSLSA